MNLNAYKKCCWRIVPIANLEEPMFVIFASNLENEDGGEVAKSTAILKSRFLAEISHGNDILST